jgi:protoheme IX farnesyltransferase
VAGALVALTKPRIIELLLVTTVPTMLLAQRGLPSLRLLLVTLVGGSLAAGSANTVNCYLDRDIDAVMKRTSRRPLVNRQGAVKPAEALAWGIALGAGATLLLGLGANWLAAALADAAIGFYVFVYTLLLKRRSPANIVIGGAAGCFPVLVGWAAVTGTVAVPALVLFAVIFLWTPPHFWALAMKFKDDYRPRRVVPARSAPPGPAGPVRRRPALPHAPVPPQHRLSDPAVRRGGGRRAPAGRPLVTAGKAKTIRSSPNGFVDLHSPHPQSLANSPG